ncbi:MAG: tRNA (adenosine(37)-N6)-threonylcarbamoyltransferase complex ATPase subunit type 1 TsaE [Myxococcota bacterium]
MIQAETHAGLDLAGVQALAHRWADDWSQALPDGDSLLIGLWGEMGAGKTSFVKSFVGALPGGDSDEVSSPTFALVHDYPSRPPVTHLDLYRLRGETEVEDIGGPELFEQPGFVFVEWPERGQAWLPGERLDLHISIEGTRRKLHLDPKIQHPKPADPT